MPPGAEGPLRALIDALPAPLVRRALTHSSWTDDRACSYERLEFLGDSVLGLAIAARLYQEYPDAEEGRLAKLKAFVVSRRSCGVVARRLGVDDLLATHTEAPEEARRELVASPTALGNILEALIGAAYLTWGFDEVQAAVTAAFAERIAYGASSYVDYKSTLQEHLAAEGRAAAYRLVASEGPPHARVFTSEILVEGEVKGIGVGRSIKKSEQRAAHGALATMGVIGSAKET